MLTDSNTIPLAIRLKKYWFILAGTFLILGLNQGTGFCYAIFILFFFWMVLWTILKEKVYIVKFYLQDLIPALLLSVWLYGFISGIVQGNKLSYVIANNAGMVLYFTYYIFLYFKVPKKKLYNITIISSYIVIIITLILFYLSQAFHYYNSGLTQKLLGNFIGGSSTGQPRIYFISQLTLFFTFAILLGRQLVSKRDRAKIVLPVISHHRKLDKLYVNFILLAVFIFAMVFITASKGYMLAFIVYLLIIPLCVFMEGLSRKKINKNALIILSLIVLLVIISLFKFNYANIIIAILKKNDKANVLRYQQAAYLFQDLTPWGRGAGAIIKGYERNNAKPYGFELSYLNAVHKFGIAFIFVLFAYLYIIFKSINQIIKGKHLGYALGALGAMGFLFPSIGNPLLFSPQAVTLNCIALYLLRYERKPA